MKNKIQYIKNLIKKHKTLFVTISIVKGLLKAGFVFYFICKANNVVAQTTNALLREGNKYYKKEKYNNATESYSKALQRDAKDVRAYFNQGDALFKLNELDKAKESFTIATKLTKNTEVQAKAHYNIGNILYKQEKWEESVKSYKSSLKLNPKDEQAKYNLMMALAKLKKNGGGGKDNKKDKNKQENKDDKKQDKDKQQQNGNQQQNQQQGNNQQQQQNQQGQNQPQNQQGQQKQGEQAGQMTNEEAQKLLDAVGAEEGKVQQKLIKEKGKPSTKKVQKDW